VDIFFEAEDGGEGWTVDSGPARQVGLGGLRHPLLVVPVNARSFPAGLMIGFRAQAEDNSVSVDGEEILEARWFTRAELAERAGRRRRQASLMFAAAARW
jgi:hypothetical protein